MRDLVAYNDSDSAIIQITLIIKVDYRANLGVNIVYKWIYTLESWHDRMAAVGFLAINQFMILIFICFYLKENHWFYLPGKLKKNKIF